MSQPSSQSSSSKSKPEAVSSQTAPQAIGPYSQAIKTNGMVFVSGQIPIDRATGEVVSGGITEQTEQVMKNLTAILESAGSGRDRVLKTSVFLKSMADFAAMNEVYAKYFTQTLLPARATVAVAGLPRDVLVEIDLIALA